MTDSARRLAEFASSLDPATLPAAVVDKARMLLLDLIGVGLRGELEFSSQRTCQALGVLAPWTAALPGASPERLALARGVAAHTIEMDDVTEESSLHPGAVAVPAVLSLAEAVDAEGGDLLAGFVAAYEAICRVGNAFGSRAHYARGFHPTATAGVFGAAAGCARVLRLDADATNHALGLAGSQASGLLAYLQNGSEAKRFNAGWAAHAGVVASLLASHGFTGPDDVFGGLHGVLAAMSDFPQPELATDGLGTRWEILKVALKPHASCRHNHAAIDAALTLRGLLPAASVDEIEVELPHASLALVAEPPERKQRPRTEVDAQFSIYFAVACAWVAGELDWDTLHERFDDPEVRSLAERVAVQGADDLEARWPLEWPARVAVRGDGRRERVGVDSPRGSTARPLTREERTSRFDRLTRRVLDPEQRARLVRAIEALPATRARDVLPARSPS